MADERLTGVPPGATLDLDKAFVEFYRVLATSTITHDAGVRLGTIFGTVFGEVERLRAAIRAHRDARGDDRCWMDDEELYRVLPEGYTAPPRDTAVELEHCRRFIASRQNPATVYVSPEREIERLRAALDAQSDVERYDAAAVQHAREREREYRRTLWAAAAGLWPNPLRVAHASLVTWAPDSELQTRTDHQTRELLIYAPHQGAALDARPPQAPQEQIVHESRSPVVDGQPQSAGAVVGEAGRLPYEAQAVHVGYPMGASRAEVKSTDAGSNPADSHPPAADARRPGQEPK